MPTLKRILVNEGWHFKQSTTLGNGMATSYLPVSQFPTVAHLDLLHHGLIKDPYVDTNEMDSLWVNDANFTYRTVLPSLPPPSSNTKAKVALVFEGLDTIFSLYLNNSPILETENMHISYRVDFTSHISPSNNWKRGENVLELRFRNAPEFAKKKR
jgi:beta-mannosidase